MIQVGEVVKLDNDKEYTVIDRMNFHNVNYVYLMTIMKPIEILVATEKIVNGDIALEEVKDNEELDYVLSQFVLNSKTQID